MFGYLKQKYKYWFTPQEQKTVYDASEKVAQDLNGKLGEVLTNDAELQKLANEIKQEVYTHIKTCLPQKIYKSVEEEAMFGYTPGTKAESSIETWLFRSRWIMAVAFLVGTLSMFALATQVGIDIWHLVETVWANIFGSKTLEEGHKEFILAMLTLLDHLLIGSLIVMVLISRYENTVSKIKTGEGGPSWLGKIGISDLKTKIASSIVAISSVHLLQIFLSIDAKNNNISSENVVLAIVIHLVFIVSAFILAKVADMHSDDAHGHIKEECRVSALAHSKNTSTHSKEEGMKNE